MHFIWFIVVGIIAGWLAGLLTKGKGFGLLGNLAVGVIGALVGGFLFAVLGLKAYTVLGSLVTSVVGAVVFLWLLRLIKPT